MFHFKISNYTLFPDIETLKIGDIAARESAIGEVDTKSMKTFLNMGMKVLVPVINGYLKDGFEIP